MEKFRRSIWLFVGMPLTVLNYLPSIILQLLWATILLILGKLQKRDKLVTYSWNLLISVDQLGNAVLGGDPDETISSRAGKMQGKSKLADMLCWILDKLDTNHCKNAIEEAEGKDKLLD